MLKVFKVKENKVACWINPRDFGAHEKSLIFIHGSGSNSGVWSHQYARLHKKYNIAAINLPGHGKSAGPGERDVYDYVRRLRDILQSLGLAKPVVVGHSLGAAISLCYAAQYPADISGVVSVGGGLNIPVNPVLLDGLAGKPDETRDLIARLSLAKANLPKFLAPVRASLDEVDLGVLAGDLTACNQLNLAPEVSGICLPALIICGMEDKMTPVESSRRIAARIAGSTLLQVEGAGHMVMMEKPLVCTEAIDHFAASLPQAIDA